MLTAILLTFTCCESAHEPSLEPLLLDRNFCPYVRILDTYCSGDREYRNDSQWIEAIKDLLVKEGIEVTDIKLGIKQPVNGVVECPCGGITGHYADVLVSEQDREKLINIGFLECKSSK